MKKLLIILLAMIPLIGCKAQTAKEITQDFRYERYEGGKSEVYFISVTEYFVGFYFRRMGENVGWYYHCGKESYYKSLLKVAKKHKLVSYPQTPLDQEDTSRSRWLVEVNKADGSKIEIVEYISDTPTNEDLKIKTEIESIFEKMIAELDKMTPEQIGEHSKTTYDGHLKPRQKINYDGHGMVLNGYDYNDPMNTF